MAIYIDFVTAPYAVSSNQLAILFVYNGLDTASKKQPIFSGCFFERRLTDTIQVTVNKTAPILLFTAPYADHSVSI
jgi:hypothetical protein